MAALLAGCVSVRHTDPPHTATEQLLITAAVDRCVEQLKLSLPDKRRVFLDPTNVDVDGTVIYPRYAIAAVRARLLQLGAQLVATREEADVVVEMRSGAQSINDRRILVGMPGFQLPVPLTGALAVPEIPLFRYHKETGVSKLALVAYDANGGLIADTGPQFGEAMRRHWVVLFVISGSSQNIQPE
jgi:hypothetical protein